MLFRSLANVGGWYEIRVIVVFVMWRCEITRDGAGECLKSVQHCIEFIMDRFLFFYKIIMVAPQGWNKGMSTVTTVRLNDSTDILCKHIF